jgi:hypothetical protein
VKGWCPGPDSNRHGISRGILSPLRLPVPPPGHGKGADNNIVAGETGWSGRKWRLGSESNRTHFTLIIRILRNRNNQPTPPQATNRSRESRWIGQSRNHTGACSIVRALANRPANRVHRSSQRSQAPHPQGPPQGYRLKGRTPAQALREALGRKELRPIVPKDDTDGERRRHNQSPETPCVGQPRNLYTPSAAKCSVRTSLFHSLHPIRPDLRLAALFICRMHVQGGH